MFYTLSDKFHDAKFAEQNNLSCELQESMVPKKVAKFIGLHSSKEGYLNHSASFINLVAEFG